MPLPYAAFMSYRSRTDYARARWVEGFIEGFHLKIDPAIKVESLSIGRDGSDFRLPSGRDAEERPDGVWPIIRAELEKSALRRNPTACPKGQLSKRRCFG